MNGGISSRIFAAFKRGFAIWTIALLCFAGGAGYAKPANAFEPGERGASAGQALATPKLYQENQALAAQEMADANKDKSTATGKFIGEVITVIFTIVRWFLTKIFSLFAWALFMVIEYNGFIDSNPVVAGWVVVRDFTNMLFIMILLVIAYAILFGREEYGSAKDLPRLFVMAILINFSRTLIGFMIDIAQVFLLTFSRAFTSGTGSDNLVRLFSVDQAAKITSSGSMFGDAVASTAIANIASVIVLTMATVVVGYLTIAMLIRIVVLWILIILAPLAWFMSVVPKVGHEVYSKWWSEFKSQLLMGPVMAFFLWLCLATAGAGANAVSDSKGPPPDLKPAPIEAATPQAIIKALIAVIMLMKGLEIATSMGGIGSKQLGAATGRAKQAAGFVVGGTAAMTGAAAGYLGGKALRGGAGLVGAGGFAEKLAKAPSIPGMALTGAGRAAGRLGLGTVAGALTGAGGKMTEAEEKRWKSRVSDVTSGGDKDLAHIQRSSLEAKAAAGGGFDLSRLNAEEKMQLKELTKGVEKEPKMWEKMTKPEEVDRYFQARAAIDADIKDPKAQREAKHHSDEMAVENLHRMQPATQENVLRELIGHGQADMIASKLPVEAITGANVGNINTLAGEPEALAKLVNKSPEAMQSVLANGSADSVRAMMKTGKVREEGLSETILKDASIPAENIAIAISKLSSADRGEIRSKENRRRAALPRMEAAVAANPARSPSVAGQSRENVIANLELHALRVTEARETGAPLPDTMDTFGYDRATGNFPDAAARANFKTVITDSGLGADFLLNIDSADIRGQLADELAANLNAGAVTEIAKRIFDGKIQKDANVAATYQALKALPAPAAGGQRLAQRMSKNKNIEAQLG